MQSVAESSSSTASSSSRRLTELHGQERPGPGLLPPPAHEPTQCSATSSSERSASSTPTSSAASSVAAAQVAPCALGAETLPNPAVVLLAGAVAGIASCAAMLTRNVRPGASVLCVRATRARLLRAVVPKAPGSSPRAGSPVRTRCTRATSLGRAARTACIVGHPRRTATAPLDRLKTLMQVGPPMGVRRPMALDGVRNGLRRRMVT